MPPMTSVYVDTNVYLDFYRHARHPLSVFKDLRKLGKRLLLPEQTIVEFERNRADAIAATLVQLAGTKIAWHTPPDMIGRLPEFNELDLARKRVGQLVDEITRKIRRYSQDDDSDDVLIEFRELCESAQRLPTSKRNIESAQHRKLLGNPPYSPGKHTIGDEVIWETLLSTCESDLLLCSRDGTFVTHEPFLRAEYQRHTGKRLTVTSDLAVAQKAGGQDDATIKKEEAVLAEQRQEVARARREAVTAASTVLRTAYGAGVSDAFRRYLGESELDELVREELFSYGRVSDGLGRLSAFDMAHREPAGQFDHLTALEKAQREAAGQFDHLTGWEKAHREAVGQFGDLTAWQKAQREAAGFAHLTASKEAQDPRTMPSGPPDAVHDDASANESRAAVRVLSDASPDEDEEK